jgi:hypothetical protein
MLNRTNIILVIVGSVVLFTTCGMQGTAVAQKTTVPKSQGLPVLGEDEVTQLLLLMDSDKDGKVSKQEWMTFMEAEKRSSTDWIRPRTDSLTSRNWHNRNSV